MHDRRRHARTTKGLVLVGRPRHSVPVQSIESWNPEYWNGPGGQRWAERQTAMDKALAAFGDALLQANPLDHGAHVLDIGCGCGSTTIQAAQRVGDEGLAIGIDVSKPMIRRAEERAKDVPNLRFVTGDAASYPFEEPFDCAISRFGSMFFRDPTAAFRHIAQQLRPGGTLTMVCWQALPANEWLTKPLQAVHSALGLAGAPSQGSDGPFSFADPEHVRAILHAAGFERFHHRPALHFVPFAETDAEEAVGFVMEHAGPVGRVLAEVSPEDRARAREALVELFGERRDSPLGFHGAAWIFSAVKPTPS